MSEDFERDVALSKLEEWIDSTNKHYSGQRKSCIEFSKKFAGFYQPEFLKGSYYVVIDSVPKPDFPELKVLGLDDFNDMDVDGITYNDTYYIIPSKQDSFQLHFHELVHVAQWKHLGKRAFLEMYISEIKELGYEKAPLEIIAYTLDDHFSKNGNHVDVVEYMKEFL